MKGLMKVLIIAAHPDDEVLGCGATASHLARQGAEVHTAILGEGVTSRQGPSREEVQAGLQGLKASAHDAATILGINPPRMFGLPDNRFDSLPLLDIIHCVEALVEEICPEVVFTHWGGDLNVDHGVTSRAVLTAVRPMRNSLVRELNLFEVPSSSEWSFGRIAGLFRPQVFVDVAEELDRKCRAMAAYEGEATVFPHPRSREGIEALARLRGAAAGVPAAEAFEQVFSVRRAGEGWI